MRIAYSTPFGRAFNCSIEDFILSPQFDELRGTVDLIVTSPPYPLVSPKAYGNRVGEDYKTWLSQVFVDLLPLLKPRGSLVVEIGNAWDKGAPTMSTLPLETLLNIRRETGLFLCQQFIWSNPNKLPGPATWVNVKRIRVKDSFTNIWWYSLTDNPMANNTRVLTPYKDGMKKLLARQTYNQGNRPSGHNIGDGFLTKNRGSIPSNVLTFPNTMESSAYRDWCKQHNVPQHPARMPEKLAEFFIKFLTNKGSLVMDPFGGSNTTGKVAEDLNRHWIYVENNPEYVIGSKGRFKRG